MFLLFSEQFLIFMGKTPAILYAKQHYLTATGRLMGRHSASEGFLKALAKYSSATDFYCYSSQEKDFQDFCEQVNSWATVTRQNHWIPHQNLEVLKEPGIIYRPDPVINRMAWERRYFDEKAYSICGITHTLASKEVMAYLGDLLIAPVQPWDAIICTSQSVKTMVEKLLSTWGNYLSQRFKAPPPEIPIQLPIIPLGVDCQSFPQGEQKKTIRQQFRQELGIGEEDLVVLFVGRLIFYAKAHPVPMYLALEKAVQTTGAKVHLIQAGWFENEREEKSFKESPALFCPNVNTIFLDGRQQIVRQRIWSIADIFISLVDNIQETFGLTPIEAMAAGLPVIASDWDGYRESVRHEIDGFLIPTLIPPAGYGLDFAYDYYRDHINYSTYIAYVSMMTAVDVNACSEALIKLFTQPELRRHLGENGRKRAKEVYDWRWIISAYEELWQNLHDLRQQSLSQTAVKLGQIPHPLADDPYRLLDYYATQILNEQDLLTLGLISSPENIKKILQVWMTNFGATTRISAIIIQEIVDLIRNKGNLSVREILDRYSSNNQLIKMRLYRSLVYLIKLDILRKI